MFRLKDPSLETVNYVQVVSGKEYPRLLFIFAYRSIAGAYIEYCTLLHAESILVAAH